MQAVRSVYAVALVLVVGAVGCKKEASESAPSASGIAVIDLDEVAKRLGQDKQIISSIRDRETALNNRLVEIAQAYTAQIEKHRSADTGESEQPAVQLAEYQQQANRNLNTARAQARQDLARHRAKEIQQFRDYVRPTAERVALGRGLSVIVTKQDDLLYNYAASCDITDEVVSALATRQSSQPAE